MSDSPTTPGNGTSSSSLMNNLLGLLRIRVKRGVNLAVRDVRSSDPYVVVKMGKQVLNFSSFSSSVFQFNFLVLRNMVYIREPVLKRMRVLSFTEMLFSSSVFLCLGFEFSGKV